MKKLLFTIGLIGLFQFVSAQDNTAEINDRTIRITLSETEAESAKSLKGLESGKVFKGESRTTFLISTTSKNLQPLKEELLVLFPSSKIAVLEGDKK